MELVFVTAFFVNFGNVIHKVVDVINEANNGINALFGILVIFFEFGTNQESIHVLILICLSEWLP